MALSKPSEHQSGGFFKPADHTTAIAVVIEPISLKENVPNTYKGKVTTRDELTADISIFPTLDSLESGKPTVLKNAIVDKTAIVNSAKNGAVAGTIRKAAGKENEYWALFDLDGTTQGQVDSWYDGREAAKKAALDSAPGFDD